MGDYVVAEYGRVVVADLDGGGISEVYGYGRAVALTVLYRPSCRSATITICESY